MLSKMTSWQAIKRGFYSYFFLLTKKWFWYYVFPVIVIFSYTMAYYEVYVKEGCYADEQRLLEMKQKDDK